MAAVRKLYRWTAVRKYRWTAAYLLLAVALIVFAYNLQRLQQQAVRNGDLTLRVLHEQCVSANAGIDLWNAQQERLTRLEQNNVQDTPQEKADKIASIRGLEFPRRQCG